MVAKFSIKDLEKLSGIKAHTLRAWELRYGILKPERTDTNIRWYCNNELKLLLNITLLYNNGFKISKIACLQNHDLVQEVNKLIDAQGKACDQIEGLIISMVELDEQRFEKIISNSILHNGFAHTIEKVVYPFLHRIGILWQTGSINPAQEHFISNLIRQKLIVAIDGVPVPAIANPQKFVLYLPDGELHELSLLYFTYVLKSKGHHVIYLGQSVPFVDLEKVFEIRSPHYIVSVFTHVPAAAEYIQQLSGTFPKTGILLSGNQCLEEGLTLPKNIRVFKTPTDLLMLIS